MSLERYTELAQKILSKNDPEQKYKGLSNLISRVADTLPNAIIDDHHDLVLSNRTLRFNNYWSEVYCYHSGIGFLDAVSFLNRYRETVEQWECDDEATIAMRKEMLSKCQQYEYRKYNNGDVHPDNIYCQHGSYRKYHDLKDTYYYRLGRMIQTINADNVNLKVTMQMVCLYVALNNERSIVTDELMLLGIEIPGTDNRPTEWNDISTLGTKADHYLGLMGFVVRNIQPQKADIKQTVNELHEAIQNVNIDEINIALSRQNANQTYVITLMSDVVTIFDKLTELMGKKLPSVKTIDPNAAEVFKFCNKVKPILHKELQALQNRRQKDPTFGDDEAVKILDSYREGDYGDMTFEDVINQFAINDLADNEVVRRLNNMINQCDDVQMILDLYKILYGRKCDVDVARELHDAMVDVIRFFDHAADMSPIPPDCNRYDATTRLYSVVEWCKQHDTEFKAQLVNCPLVKDVEDIGQLATHIAECSGNWCSVIGNDTLLLQLINDIAGILDNAIIPTIKQRNPTQSQATPSHEPPQASQSTEATTTNNTAQYKPITAFNMSALFSFLINEGVFDKGEIDVKQFEECINQADIKLLMEKTQSKNRLKLTLQVLKEYYQDQMQKHKRINPSWYLQCCESVAMSPQDMGKMTFKKLTKDKFCRELKKNISLP